MGAARRAGSGPTRACNAQARSGQGASRPSRGGPGSRAPRLCRRHDRPGRDRQRGGNGRVDRTGSLTLLEPGPECRRTAGGGRRVARRTGAVATTRGNRVGRRRQGPAAAAAGAEAVRRAADAAGHPAARRASPRRRASEGRAVGPLPRAATQTVRCDRHQREQAQALDRGSRVEPERFGRSAGGLRGAGEAGR